MPDPDRGPAGFLLQCGGASLLVDGGSGTLQRLARAGVDTLELATDDDLLGSLLRFADLRRRRAYTGRFPTHLQGAPA